MPGDIKPTSASDIIAELTKRGYDRSAQHRYACAERSWCKKGEPDWNVWKQVEALTSSDSESPAA